MTTRVRIRNVSPQGDLVVPLLGNVEVARGEVIEVSAAHAEILTRQSIWQRVEDRAAKKASKGAAQADDAGVPADATDDPSATTAPLGEEKK